MAIRLLQTGIIANYETTASNTFYAGDGLILDTSNANAVRVAAASNNAVTQELFAGFATSDHNTTGNTIIQADPVGSSTVSADGSTFTSYANGWYVGAARRIGDYQNESVNVVTNLTDSSPTPRRGVGCVKQDGSQFLTDRFVTLTTTTAGTDLFITCAAAEAAADLGKLNDDSTNNGDVVARIDEHDSDAGLLFVTVNYHRV
jgi:hypothetical protein